MASSGRITAARAGADRAGSVVTIVASPARDFALVCSDRFEVLRAAGRRDARPGRLASPSTRATPSAILEYACEVIPLYEQLVRPVLRRRVRDRPVVLRLERQRVLGPGPARRPGDAAPLGRRALPRPPGHPRDAATSGSGTSSAPTAMPRRSWTRGWSTASPRMRLDAKYGRNAPADRLAARADAGCRRSAARTSGWPATTAGGHGATTGR